MFCKKLDFISELNYLKFKTLIAMKRMLSSRCLFAALLLLFSSWALYAQSSSSKSVDYTGTSEIEVSVGLPVPQFSTAFSSLVRGYVKMADLFLGLTGAATGAHLDYPDPVERSGGSSVRLPAFRLEYGYNIKQWLNVGGGVYYTHNAWPLKYSGTGTPAWTEKAHTVSVMANVRFYWLNRPLVRMYSGIGAGVGIVTSNMGALTASESVNMDTYCTLALDVRLVGLTVGRRVYGRFEAGVLGTGLVTAGIGCRF